jgi:signal transduction histidine kinase
LADATDVDSDPVPTLVLNVGTKSRLERAMEKTFGIPALEWWAHGTSGVRSMKLRPVRGHHAGPCERSGAAYCTRRIQRSELISDAWEVEDYFAHLDKWFVFTATLLHDARGSVIGAIETLVDVTERKRVQEQLTEAQQQLVQAEKMASIGQLAAGVAHEINNPIGYVHSNLNALAAVDCSGAEM